MAASDHKITNAEIAAVHVEAQPDTLQGSAQDNKKVFDRYCDMIAGKHNSLCDYVGSQSPAVDSAVVALFNSLNQ
jgi:hypothetical protein